MATGKNYKYLSIHAKTKHKQNSVLVVINENENEKPGIVC